MHLNRRHELYLLSLFFLMTNPVNLIECVCRTELFCIWPEVEVNILINSGLSSSSNERRS